ncbi:hypothetical protein BGZ46_007561 [Entomortierella lignicola]|nr:hypothetical protein BGZ46_007561 [Entomortierella lignicola]
MVCTVDSILAIYSRFGGPYAHSIRWVRQGGYLEMYNTLVNSRECLSNETKLVLIITILSSIAASVVDVGAVYFIHPSIRLHNISFQLVETSQFAPFDYTRSFSGWDAFVPNGADIGEAMALMVNNTNHIPNAIVGRMYTARTSEYQVGCGILNFQLLNTTDKLFINQGGCATAGFYLSVPYIGLWEDSIVVEGPDGRLSSKTLGTYYLELVEIPTYIDLYYGNITCTLNDDPLLDLLSSPLNGLTSTPVTWTTRCVLPAGEIVALSLTSIKFSSAKLQDFKHVTSSLFGGEDEELITAMEESIKTATNQPTLFSELRYGNSTLDAVVCISTGSKQLPLHATCTYTSFTAVIVAKQEFNPAIAAARGGAPFGDPATEVILTPGDIGKSSLAMKISHIPSLINGTFHQLSISDVKNASFASAHYLASLGMNFYMDWNTSRLYVIYDTLDVEKGLEIPSWLSIIVLLAMLLCAVFCCLTQYLLTPIYTGSLYKVMSIQMTPKSNSFADMIRWSKAYSNGYEGFRTTPDDKKFYEVDLNSETSLTRTL